MSQSSDKNQVGLLARLADRVLLGWRLLLDRRVRFQNKLIPFFVVLAYVIFPIDFIPDPLIAFFGLGALDDIAAMIIGLELFIRSAPAPVVAEHRRKMRGMFEKSSAPPPTDEGDVIEGEFTVKR
jgi:uncharacterized membrane protein YkvA (DUF1232 family)